MIIDRMGEGKKIWFTHQDKDGNGKSRSIGHEGIILSFDRDNVSVMGTDEQVYDVKPYRCYESEKEMSFDLKMDQFTENFSNRINEAAEKYINGCKNLIKNNILKMSPEKEMITNEMKMRFQMIGAGFKEQVSSLTENFVSSTQKHMAEHINSMAKDLMLHTDLSQYEPGGITLVAKDLEGLSDEGISLSDDDLAGIGTEGSGLKL